MIPKGNHPPEIKERHDRWCGTARDRWTMIAYMHVSMIACYSAMKMQDLMLALSAENQGTKRECKVPQSLARFFVISPSFPAFNTRGTSKLLTWHLTNRSTYGVMRVWANSPPWQHIKQTWSEFREDPRHLRLGL